MRIILVRSGYYNTYICFKVSPIILNFQQQKTRQHGNKDYHVKLDVTASFNIYVLRRLTNSYKWLISYTCICMVLRKVFVDGFLSNVAMGILTVQTNKLNFLGFILDYDSKNTANI